MSLPMSSVGHAQIEKFKRLALQTRFYIIGSAEALPILCVRYARWERERDTEKEREREREIDGSDVIIVALKLAMCLHFPMPKLRTIAVSSHFPLPKYRTFRFSLHTSCLTIGGAEIRSSHFPLPKNSPSLFRLSMARAARRVIENPRQMIKFCPVLLFFPSKKWIKLIPKTIRNRKRDCAWGGSGW